MSLIEAIGGVPASEITRETFGNRARNVPRDIAPFVNISFGSKPTITELSLSDIELDESQRYYNENNAKQYIKHVKGFDWNLFGVPTVVKYPDNRFKCVNGQHRIMILKMLLPDVDKINVHLIDFSEYSHELATIKSALLFSNTNGRTISKVKAEELFWADIIANDPKALHLLDILRKCGFSCGKVNEVPESLCAQKSVKFANFEKCVNLSEEATVYAARLIEDTWPEERKFNDILFIGLVRLFTTSGYESLMDPSTTCGAEFEQWFLNLGVLGINGKTLRFMNYRENGDWAKGAAYGLFSMYKDVSKKCQLAEKTLKEAYQSDSVDNS